MSDHTDFVEPQDDVAADSGFDLLQILFWICLAVAVGAGWGSPVLARSGGTSSASASDCSWSVGNGSALVGASRGWSALGIVPG